MCGVQFSDTLRFYLFLVRRWYELFGVPAQADSGIMILTFLIYPNKNYCAYNWCLPL